MQTYMFRLHDGPGVSPILETVVAQDDDEARDLAHLRLSLSHAFTHVDVLEAGRVVASLHRDSQQPLRPHERRASSATAREM